MELFILQSRIFAGISKGLIFVDLSNQVAQLLRFWQSLPQIRVPRRKAHHSCASPSQRIHNLISEYFVLMI